MIRMNSPILPFEISSGTQAERFLLRLLAWLASGILGRNFGIDELLQYLIFLEELAEFT